MRVVRAQANVKYANDDENKIANTTEKGDLVNKSKLNICPLIIITTVMTTE
jgi:hypothetical protein